MTEKSVAESSNVRFPIGFKLITFISILLLVALGGLTMLVTIMVGNDVRITAETNNMENNLRAVSDTENLLNLVRSGTVNLLDTLDLFGGPLAANAERAVYIFFKQNYNIAAISFWGRTFINYSFFAEKASPVPPIEDLFMQWQEFEEAERLKNVSPEFDIPMAFLGFPHENGHIYVLFSADALSMSYGQGINKSVLLNSYGEIIVHYDPVMNRIGGRVFDDEQIRAVMESPVRTIQVIYTNAEGTRFFTSFSKLPQTASIVVTYIEYDKVFQGVVATRNQNIFLAGAVLLTAILFIWFFSKSISIPLKNLSAAAVRIADGDYELSLPVKGADEISALTSSFISMGKGLAERERLKDSFGRFTNPAIVEQAMTGKLALGGENKHATIFFSDIRLFTTMAEEMSPQDIVGFLNSYMTKMVDCITTTGGVVDKFIGDAIMSVWGAPVSHGDPGQDAMAAVRAALLMRGALHELNKARDTPQRPFIRIGCGINTGDVVAGQIGSSKRMEYTVVGDAVNLAARTESLNKVFNTDILITENTWKFVKDKILVEEMPSVQIRGKKKPVRIFAVINEIAEGEETPEIASLAQVRHILRLPEPNFDKVDLDADKEYKINQES